MSRSLSIRLLAGTVSLLLGLARPASTHPAHAEPVNYPFVVGFERFYTSMDTPAHLAEGGFLLLNELNCVACHRPPEHLANVLTGRPGTRLDGVGSRFDPLDLEMMIRNPRFVKTDTTMPSFFSGPDRDLEEIDALKHFLATLVEETPSFPDGDIDAGRILYHQIGCVACHAPEKDYRPDWIPGNIEVSLTSLPSVPLNLADRYPREVLIDLILDPAKYRPSGRMPRFPLTHTEALDLGSYLNSAPKPELPDILRRALAKAEPFRPEAEQIARGRTLFRTKNCVACHSGIVAADPIPAAPLARLDFSQPSGCLAERPPGGAVPAYGLDPLQKQAIREALSRIGTRSSDRAEEKADWLLSRMNCYACHERGGKGGPEAAREVYFTHTDPDAVGDGFWATRPPVLDHAGARLTVACWDTVLHQQTGSGAVREHMAVRMPAYRPVDTDGLVAWLRELDLPREPRGPFPRGDAKRGHRLIGFDEMNCVQCHGVGELPPPGVRSVPLTGVTERLEKDFFFRLLEEPESLRPQYPAPHPPIDRQSIADLWAYLENIAAFPPPDGLLRPDTTLLHPAEGRPVVLRTAIRGIGNDLIAIGFPGERNAAFDPESCRWAAAWTGTFLDPGPDWKSAEPRAVDLPEDALPLPLGGKSWRPENPRYRGYRIDPDGRPVLLYTDGEKEVAEHFTDEGTRRIEIRVGDDISIVEEPFPAP